MKVTKLKYEWPEPYKICTDGVHVERSKGLHLSDIIRGTAIRMGYINPENGNDLCAHLGIAFENYVIHMIRASRPDSEFMFHPGEFVMDGIAMSPDIIEIPPDGEIISHEIKMTWTKPGQAIEKHWYWLAQLMSYCRAEKTLKGVMHSCHAAGFYHPPFPVYEAQLIEFTKQDLEENWQMVLREAKSFR